MADLIAPRSLKDLVDARAIQAARVVADRDVFKVLVKYGSAERLVSVRTQSGAMKVREFVSLDAVARFMREKLQMAHYEVDATHFEPQQKCKGKSRPDMALRLKRAHMALSHQEWLEQKVEASRAGLVNGINAIVEPDAWEQLREQKHQQRDAR